VRSSSGCLVALTALVWDLLADVRFERDGQWGLTVRSASLDLDFIDITLLLLSLLVSLVWDLSEDVQFERGSWNYSRWGERASTSTSSTSRCCFFPCLFPLSGIYQKMSSLSGGAGTTHGGASELRPRLHRHHAAASFPACFPCLGSIRGCPIRAGGAGLLTVGRASLDLDFTLLLLSLLVSLVWDLLEDVQFERGKYSYSR
jgi:hypothetical protein